MTADRHAVTTRGVSVAALLAALGRPSWWILALAGFLVRGGIVAFLVAIVMLPSPLAISTALGPIVTPLYLGRLEATTVTAIVGAVALVVGWLVVGGWFAAATEVALIRVSLRAGADEGMPIADPSRMSRFVTGRAALAHLLALVPFAVVLGLGSIRIVGVAYLELTNPSDDGSLVLRIVSRATVPVAVIVATWVVGEIVGGRAVRRIVGGDSVGAALASATADLFRRPAAALLAPLATTALLVLDLAAALAAVAIVWTELRSRLVDPLDSPVATVLALATFGAAWCLALLVTGLIAAWRSVAMTFEVELARLAVRLRGTAGPYPGDGGPTDRGSPGGGTIGVTPVRRPGDWSADDRGGSL